MEPQDPLPSLFLAADAAWRTGDFERMLTLLAPAAPDAAADSESLGGILRRSHAELALGHVATALALARQAAHAARDANRMPEEVEALALCAEALTHEGRTVEAVEHAALGVRLGEENGPGRREIALAHASHALALAAAGAFTLARQCCASLRDLARDEDSTGIWPQLAQIEAWVNSLEHAELQLNGRATPHLDDWPHGDDRPLGLTVSAWQAADRAFGIANWQAVLRQSTLMLERAERAGHFPLQVLALRFAAHAYRMLAQHREEADSLRRISSLSTLSSACWQSLQASAAQLALLRTAEGRIDSLRTLSQQLEQWAFQDELTGLANMRRFNEVLTAWSALPDARRPALCVAMLDVDKFKRINDDFSHAVGNEVLRGIADLMRANIREGDVGVRWAGDEFAILFADDVETVQPVAQRLQGAVSDHRWSDIAPGLKVSVSLGLVQALPGDNRRTLLERSDKAMYSDKLARARRQVERQVPRAVVMEVSRWVRRARHMVVFVGPGHDTGGAVCGGHLADWSLQQQADFGHVQGWRRDPEAFHAFWQEWRKHNDAQRQPGEVHQLLRALQQRVPSVAYVTERVDGLLGMAGINNVLSLYGDAYRDRCDACGTVRPNCSEGRCLSCFAPRTTIRPDIVLLGEHPDARLIAGAEFSAKRADVILVLDADLTISPSASMLSKARTRGARVIMFGHDSRTRRDLCDVSVSVEPSIFFKVLLDELDASHSPVLADERLTDEGVSSMCFLSGQGVDDRGRSLQDVLAWSDWDLERDPRPVPWMFPLTTHSRMDPSSPVPSGEDFAAMAADPLVIEGVRRAFNRMLAFYGFEWNDGVRCSSLWASKASLWADQPGHHDQFLSRIIGSLSLLGLRSEARSLLSALETEVHARRGPRIAVPLRHWRLAAEAGEGKLAN